MSPLIRAQVASVINGEVQKLIPKFFKLESHDWIYLNSVGILLILQKLRENVFITPSNTEE
jgi:hypothetical protein